MLFADMSRQKGGIWSKDNHFLAPLVQEDGYPSREDGDSGNGKSPPLAMITNPHPHPHPQWGVAQLMTSNYRKKQYKFFFIPHLTSRHQRAIGSIDLR